MLVLSRKQEERIQIGENVTITILQVKGRSVRIGIDAPQEMHIVRSELSSDESDQASPADSEQAPKSLRPERKTPQSEQPAVRRRDRVREERRSPAFGRRRMVSDAGNGPLRRYLDERGRSDQQSALSPMMCPDERQQQSPSRREQSLLCQERSPLRRKLSCEAIIDRPQIDLHLDPYQQAPALRHGREARFRDADESPILRALRWRT